MLILNKQLIVAEDFEWGFGTVEQTRSLLGVPTLYSFNKVNAEHIPAKLKDATESTVQISLDEKATQTYVDASFAWLHGDAFTMFEVKTPVNASEAANKDYVDTELTSQYTLIENNFASKTNVLLKDNTTPYTPSAAYHPATRQYVLDTVTNIGAGDMAKAVYDTNDTGIVDNAESLGGISSDSADLYRGTLTDVDGLSLYGLWDGQDVSNSPTSGNIVIHNTKGLSTELSVQKVFSASDRRFYRRHRLTDASAFSSWVSDITTEDVIDDLTHTNVDKPLSANQGKVLNDKITSMSGVPIGTILMFAGILGDLDSTWQVCDGSNNTPDLRDKFIMGTSTQGGIGVSGGTVESTMPAHTHTANHSHTGITVSSGEHYHNATHNHSASSNTTGSHKHNGVMRLVYTGQGELGSSSGYLVEEDYWDKDTTYAGDHSHSITVNTKSMNTSDAGSHTHNVTIDTENVVTSSTGGTGDNRPPFYTLAYIMKIS